MTKTNRLLRLAALGSQLLNVLLLNGSPDETISGRAYRRGVLMGSDRWARVQRGIDRVFFFQREHCRASHSRDVAFARGIMALYEGDG